MALKGLAFRFREVLYNELSTFRFFSQFSPFKGLILVSTLQLGVGGDNIGKVVIEWLRV